MRAPAGYTVQYWDGSTWRDAEDPRKTPEPPAGGQFNEVRFRKFKASRVRVVFTHQPRVRSGLSEILVWPE